MALWRAAGHGAHIERMSWIVEEHEGKVLLSSRMPTHEPFMRLRTGVMARIKYGVRTCGNSDPRFVPR